MASIKWLVITYSLPSEPSKLRVGAWRNLRKLGAVNIHQSMWVLPFGEKNYASLFSIAEDLENNNGNTFIMQSVFMEEKYEQKAISYFNEARKIEYEEIIDKCEDFFKEIETETSKKNFTFAEAEENEEELAKLLTWFDKIKLRDIFGSTLRESTFEILENCKKIFDDFNNTVYETERQDKNC